MGRDQQVKGTVITAIRKQVMPTVAIVMQMTRCLNCVKYENG